MARSKFANLIDPSGKKVRRLALVEFLQYGIKYVFSQKHGSITRGVPTSYSIPPLSNIIDSQENYVWASGKGKVRGQNIIPLYPSEIDAAVNDPKLHELLALVDALRVGRVREKEIATRELELRLLNEE